MAIAIEVNNKQFLIPESDDPCDMWRVYFIRLKKEVGAENARTIWLITWSKNGSITCVTNAEFNRFLKKNQIDVTTAATRAVADIGAIGNGLFGLGKSLTKVLSIGIPVALSGMLLVILMILFNTAKKADVRDLAALTPAGSASKLSGITKMLKG